jgi:predicted membrane protein
LGRAPTQEPQSAATSPADRGTYIPFDAPGAAQGTFAVAINSQGAIVGYYYDTNLVAHGFVRSREGWITDINVPGAGTSSYQGTSAVAINSAGVITGNYYDANSGDHGFVRAINGKVTSFDVPGAFFYSTAGAIDLEGNVTGTYYDTNFVTHGFLRSADGTVITIDPAGSAGTQAFGITARGAVIGCYADESTVGHGFIRARNGATTTFDLPNSATYDPGCSGDSGYFAGNIPLVGNNPAGQMTGAYFEPISGNPFGGTYRGFLRADDGSYTTFDAVPSPSSPCCTWTFGVAINPAGVIVGFDDDYNNVNHGFIRATDGTVTILDAPGAGTGLNEGTWALAINQASVVVGQYQDANGLMHSFLRCPGSGNAHGCGACQ